MLDPVSESAIVARWSLRQRPAAPTFTPSSRAPARMRRTRQWGTHIQRAIAAMVMLTIVICALFSQWLSPTDPLAISLSDTFKAPNTTHWFGTDQLGRDVLSRVMYATQLTLLVAISVVTLAGVIGSLLGIIAGYFGGIADAIIMRLADLQLALPAIILAMVLAGAVGQTLPNLIIVLALASWARFARVVRGEVLSLRTRDFVLLVKLAGASRWWIMLRHIAPNIVGSFVVLASLDLGVVIVLEATLSFLGLGVQPPQVSWGGLIAEGRGFLSNAWWVCVFPGVVLIAAVLSANILGDALRDRLNPALPPTW